MKIEINRCLDVRYKTINNTYPICIRIYHNRKYDYIQTGINLSKTEYEEMHFSKVTSALKDVLKTVIDVERVVTEYLNQIKIYDIKRLRLRVKKYVSTEVEFQANNNSENVFDWFNRKIEICKKNKQFGNAQSYQSTSNVYQNYLKASDASFSFFDIQQLREIESRMMQERKIEISTVGKHARNLRAIFKLALSEDFITNKDYPFGRYKYIIPEVTKAKKALSRKSMSELMNYKPTNYYEKRAISYFIFSYFGNGMNLKDMALLKYKDYKDDVLIYFRKKTKNTTNKLKVLRVIVTEEMKEVINEFGNPIPNADNYIFTIVELGMEEERINTCIHTRSKTINNTLNIICKKLGFDKKVTLGMARHSFANALKQEGVSLNFIQESLGHTSAATTEHYINSFEHSISFEHIKKLKKYYK